MDEKKVSFIVPVYKTELYLERSLKSLLEQDYENVEIVVVADGKSDEAKRIYDKLHRKDKRLVKYVTQDHAGACRARNEGFTHTTGDYVCFWDSDSYIEPGEVRVWVRCFENHPELSFVYSGYTILSEPRHYYESMPFDPYLLTCHNYISTMNPMKREVFPGFDENIKSLQDWDMWLTIVEKGGKGWMLEDSGFNTEPAKKGSITFEGCSPENWSERYEAVRKKHNITGRTVAFTSIGNAFRAQQLAKLYKQDYVAYNGRVPASTKKIYNIGLYADSANYSTQIFCDLPKEIKKYTHWTGIDIESIFSRVPYKAIKPFVAALNNIDFHYCENETTMSMLEEIGIDVKKMKVMPLPMEVKPVAMPKKFKVYYEDDPGGHQLITSVINACPDITFENTEGAEITDYACFLAITASDMPSENLKRFVAADRYVISTYRELYAGYTEPNIEKIINAIREVKRRWRKRDFNLKAGKAYREMLNLDIFRKEIIDETSD